MKNIYNANAYSAKLKDIKRSWFLIDASDSTLGRLASRIALILRGKHKSTYTPFMNCGDHVIVINAASIKFTGNARAKKFYWHTGHPGGIKERSFEEILSGKYPERLLINTIKGMMPKESPLARLQLKTLLHVYPGGEHVHTAQKPEQIKVLDY
ncbi:MAG: 50S ribosomal protein L13 [Proteobacteria bacterium]|nr:50S ribosomal protein L13 [Pseudomonadota bacterium]